MAQQIKVNSSTGNIQIQISRGAIGPSTTANVANTALNLNAASTANVIIGGGVANYVLSTDGAGNTSWVAQTGGGGTPGGANTQVQFNDQGSFGAEPNFTYDKATDVLTADHFSGEGGNLSNIQGANVSGEVSFAATANAVALANVAGAGNIASVNLDGNVANVLRGDGTFSPDTAATPGGSNTQVQYNDNGSFAGEANFTYDSATGNLTAPNIIASTQFTGDINGAILVEVYNASGGTLNKGDIVALNGAAHGSTPDVVKADSGNASLMPGFAVVKNNISSTAVGEAVISGKMNFSSHGFTVGAQLYVDGAGTFTETRPSGENELVQKIATVTNSNTLNIAGAGRTNDIPNLNEGNIFLGNASNVGATTNLNSAINTHLAAFGSNTITTTGLITGDGGGLSNIAGGNVSGSVANAVYADSAGSAPPAGSDQQVQFNDGGALGADSVFTYNKSIPALSVGFANTGAVYTSQLATNKTLTTNTFVFSTTANLNNASVDYTVWKANVTDTNSGANTKLIDMIVDGNSMMTLSKTGALEVSGNVTGDNLNGVNANLTGNVDATNVLTTSGNISYNITPSQTDITGEGLDCTTTIVGYADYSTYQFGTSHMNMLENMDDGTEFAYFGRIKEDWGFAKNANNDQASAGYISWSVNDILDPNTYPNQSVIGGTWSVQIPTLGSDYESGAFDTRTWSGFEVGGQGGLNLTDGSGGIGIPTFNINHYQDDGLRFNRRTGNGAARSAVVADDYLGEISWRGAVDATSFLATVTSSDSGTNFFTADDVGAMDPNMEVQFFGTTFGGVSTGVSYWLSYVDYDTNEFSISDTRFGPERALTTGSGSMDIEQVSLPYSSPAKFGAKVDSSFTGAVNDPLPIGLEMIVIDDADNPITHSFYANGNSSFSGDVTATNINATQFVVLANDTVANLTSNTPAVVGVAGAMIAVSDQDYQPAHWSVTDNVWKYVSNRANV